MVSAWCTEQGSAHEEMTDCRAKRHQERYGRKLAVYGRCLRVALHVDGKKMMLYHAYPHATLHVLSRYERVNSLNSTLTCRPVRCSASIMACRFSAEMVIGFSVMASQLWSMARMLSDRQPCHFYSDGKGRVLRGHGYRLTGLYSHKRPAEAALR